MAEQRAQPRSRMFQVGGKPPVLSKEFLYGLYWESGLSTTDIAQQLGIGRSKAGDLLHQAGIPTRNHREAYLAAERAGKLMHLYGPDHPNFKGGVTYKKGYRLVYKPNHPRAVHGAGYVFEHIVVWEESHNMPLPDGWIVHHLNGIKDDNLPENLKGLPRKKHNTIEFIKALQERIRELEGNHE